LKESSHWKLDEHGLGEGCCRLESVDIPFAMDLPVPKLLHVEIVVQLTGCRIGRNNQENKCVEKLNVCIESGMNDEGCKDMRFTKSDVVKGNSSRFNFKLPLKDKDSKDATLKLKVKDFNGEISMVVFYFDYCPAKRLELVKFPAALLKTNVIGQCVLNAVAVNKTQLSHECDSSSQSTYNGFCVCDSGFERINNSCVG